MAFDVAARLAEGGPAISDFEDYVSAAHALGYQSPDLTAHAAQIRDLYGTEDGLDLQALDADAAALSRLASLAGEALQAEAQRLAELTVAWNGQAAESARDFVGRHQDSAVVVSAAVQKASGALNALRDQLWHAVDGKVDTVQAIDARCGPQRAEWLAAAHTVLSGGGDRAAASEIVDQRVRPFVEGDIASDWVAAMHASTDSVTAAYDDAIAGVKPDQVVSFGVPGFVGQTWQPPADVSPARGPIDGGLRPGPAAAEATVGQTVPAAAAAPSPALAANAPPATPPAVAAAPEPPPPTSGLGDLGAMPGLGAMPALGAGMSGIGRQLSDGIAGLTGAGRDALSDGDDVGQDEDPDDVDDEDPDDEDPDDEDPDDEDPDDEDPDDDDDADDEPEDEESNDSEHAIVDPEDLESRVDADRSKSTNEPPTLTPPPPPIPTPSPEPSPIDRNPGPPPERTPCAIAADEVPQVGE